MEYKVSYTEYAELYQEIIFPDTEQTSPNGSLAQKPLCVGQHEEKYVASVIIMIAEQVLARFIPDDEKHIPN